MVCNSIYCEPDCPFIVPHNLRDVSSAECSNYGTLLHGDPFVRPLICISGGYMTRRGVLELPDRTEY